MHFIAIAHGYDNPDRWIPLNLRNRVALTFVHLQLDKLLQISERVHIDVAQAIVLHTPESSLRR